MEKMRIKPNLNRSDNVRQAEVGWLAVGCKGQRGFSLVELMVTIIIMSVLVSIGIPAFASWKERQAASSAASALLGHLKQARGLALAENRSVSIVFSSTDYTFDADTTTAPAPSCGPCRNNVISYNQFSNKLTISPTTTRTFTSRGTANSGTITLTALGNSERVVINVIGRAFLQ